MTYATLADRLWTHEGTSAFLRSGTLALLGSALVAVAAQISVPMWPVPMTLQTLAVLAVGAAYGGRLGAATLALYALEGAVGLPVFSGAKSGIGDASLNYFLPASSMGYVLGFIIAAWLVGHLVEKGWGASLGKSALAALIGGVVLYVPGLIWLAIWAATTQGMEANAAISAAISWGLTPFLLGDIIKALVAGLGVAGLASLIRR